MSDPIFLGYTGLQASTLVPEPNGSYLHDSHYKAPAEGLNGSALGLMAIISMFQYQAPYMTGPYAGAVSQASKAAYIQSGGQALQTKLQSRAETEAKNIVYATGINEKQLGAVLGTVKVIRDRRLDLNGPKILSISTNLTATPNSGSVGLKWSFK